MCALDRRVRGDRRSRRRAHLVQRLPRELPHVAGGPAVHREEADARLLHRAAPLARHRRERGVLRADASSAPFGEPRVLPRERERDSHPGPGRRDPGAGRQGLRSHREGEQREPDRTPPVDPGPRSDCARRRFGRSRVRGGGAAPRRPVDPVEECEGRGGGSPRDLPREAAQGGAQWPLRRARLGATGEAHGSDAPRGPGRRLAAAHGGACPRRLHAVRAKDDGQRWRARHRRGGGPPGGAAPLAPRRGEPRRGLLLLAGRGATPSVGDEERRGRGSRRAVQEGLCPLAGAKRRPKASEAGLRAGALRLAALALPPADLGGLARVWLRRQLDSRAHLRGQGRLGHPALHGLAGRRRIARRARRSGATVGPVPSTTRSSSVASAPTIPYVRPTSRTTSPGDRIASSKGPRATDACSSPSLRASG